MATRRSSVRIRRGFDLPLDGAPQQEIRAGPPVAEVGLFTADHPGLRARARVAVGDAVKLGQCLLVDRRHPEIRFTSPAAGVVTAVQVGRRRRLEAVTVRPTGETSEHFRAWEPDQLAGIERADVQEQLLRAGL